MPFMDIDEPYGIPKIVQHLKKEIGVKNIETHIHDDYGFGSASSIAGFWHGANWTSVTFLGIGERAGNSEMEKILLFLVDRVEGFERYNLEPVTRFARFMEKELGCGFRETRRLSGKTFLPMNPGYMPQAFSKIPSITNPILQNW